MNRINAKTVETRLGKRFAALKAEGRGGLVTFVTAGDPNPEIGFEIFKGLPAAGADIIELGMPFSDPMAEGPAIQASSERALAGGMTVRKTLDQVRAFRLTDDETPVVLMGYFNPIHHYGVDKFVTDAKQAGVDGLIIVDLPPEEEAELCLPALKGGINFIYLATPTTDDKRLPRVVENASGFVYYVSVKGTTGAGSAAVSDIDAAVSRIRNHTDLPVAVGFGITTPEAAGDVASVSDAAVVGSAIVNKVRDHLDDAGAPRPGLVDEVLGFVKELADGVRKTKS